MARYNVEEMMRDLDGYESRPKYDPPTHECRRCRVKSPEKKGLTPKCGVCGQKMTLIVE